MFCTLCGLLERYSCLVRLKTFQMKNESFNENTSDLVFWFSKISQPRAARKKRKDVEYFKSIYVLLSRATEAQGLIIRDTDAKDKNDADAINQNASDTTTDDNSDEGIENKTDKSVLAKDKDMVKKDDVSNKIFDRVRRSAAAEIDPTTRKEVREHSIMVNVK